MNNQTITGHADSDAYFVSKLIKENNFIAVVSLSETCKAWYATVQKGVQQIFGKEKFLQDRLIEQAVVKYTTLACYGVLEKKSEACPFPIATFMEYYWKQNQPLIFPINNREDFLSLANRNQNSQRGASSMLDFVQKFIKEENLGDEIEAATRVSRLFNEPTSTAINSIPMLNRLLKLFLLNRGDSFCIEIITCIIASSKALLRGNMLKENISSRIKNGYFWLALIESEEIQNIDKLLENYDSLSPNWFQLQNAVTENDLKRRELVLAIEKSCSPDQKYLKLVMI